MESSASLIDLRNGIPLATAIPYLSGLNIGPTTTSAPVPNFPAQYLTSSSPLFARLRRFRGGINAWHGQQKCEDAQSNESLN